LKNAAAHDHILNGSSSAVQCTAGFPAAFLLTSCCAMHSRIYNRPWSSLLDCCQQSIGENPAAVSSSKGSRILQKSLLLVFCKILLPFEF
jgi:hypothetical protein